MRVVLTGGTCTGKSTLLNELARMGYSVVPECARRVIEQQGGRKGWTTFDDMERKMFTLQLEEEKKLDKIEDEVGLVFLDRGQPDYPGYCLEYTGEIPEWMKPHMPMDNLYDAVFVLDFVPYRTDAIRFENADQARAIHHRIIQSYWDNGYQLTFVPFIPVENRATYILHKLKDWYGSSILR